jgi:diaminopimelate epimerase
VTSIKYIKMTGSGNDFILIDNMNRQYVAEKMQTSVPKICTRGMSVGADGLILVEPSEVADFSWRFFNSDGSDAGMCGNGARCAARFAYKKGYAKKKMSFLTSAGIIKAEIRNEPYVKTQLTPYTDLELDKKGLAAEGVLLYHFVNTGVPHAVIFADDIEKLNLNHLGRKLRYHPEFHTEGANINFVKVADTNVLRVRTYERGVEQETLACGTGATACALVAIEKKLVQSPVNITTSGGTDLIVYKKNDVLYLEGEARMLTEGIILPEAIEY